VNNRPLISIDPSGMDSVNGVGVLACNPCSDPGLYYGGILGSGGGPLSGGPILQTGMPISFPQSCLGICVSPPIIPINSVPLGPINIGDFGAFTGSATASIGLQVVKCFTNPQSCYAPISAPAKPAPAFTLDDLCSSGTCLKVLAASANFSAGAGDFLSLGLTIPARKTISWLNGNGYGDNVNYRSGAYYTGVATGASIDLAYGVTRAAIAGGKYGRLFGRGGQATFNRVLFDSVGTGLRRAMQSDFE
jgi:hypothetical protein